MLKVIYKIPVDIAQIFKIHMLSTNQRHRYGIIYVMMGLMFKLFAMMGLILKTSYRCVINASKCRFWLEKFNDS